MKKKVRMCENCGKVAEKMKKCSVCRLVRYCSEECQLEDWTEHEGLCKKAVKGHNSGQGS